MWLGAVGRTRTNSGRLKRPVPILLGVDGMDVPPIRFLSWERQDSNLRTGLRPDWFTASLLCHSDARSPLGEPQ
jgi:hypothetical protein